MTASPRIDRRVGIKPLILLSVLSGCCLWGSFWVPWLAWVGLAPLFLLVGLNGSRPALYLGAWLGGLALFVPGVQWIRYSDPGAWIGWLFLSIYLALYFPAFVLVARVLHRRWRLPILFAAPASWVALEYVRMHALSGFGWLLVAHSLHSWPAMIQIADLGGVYLVSFVIASVNALWIELLTLPLVLQPSASELSHGKGKKHAKEGSQDPAIGRWNPAVVWRVVITFVLVLGTWLYGQFRLRTAEETPGPVVLALQTNLEQKLKLNNIDEAIRQVLALTHRARKIPADLLIWPETSYPYYYGSVAKEIGDEELDRLRVAHFGVAQRADLPKPTAERGKELREALVNARDDVARIADQVGKPLLVGLIRFDFRPGRMFMFNSSVLVVPGEGEVVAYDKVHPVPFGEYLPFEDLFPYLGFLLPYESGLESLDAATELRSIHHGNLNLASMICFEDTVPDIARAFLLQSTPERPIDFLVNQTNDGWFNGSAEAEYHLAAGLFRCVEVRRPMLRVSNTGMTALVDGSGVVRQVLTDSKGQTKLFADLLKVTIPIDRRSSLYVAFGDWLAWSCVVVVLVGLFASTIRHLRKLARFQTGDQQGNV
ncbi:MAG: apolipoprotein N-acyltransferase [Planctomycetota bacterium]